MREIIKNIGFNAVAPGQKASARLPVDRLYYGLALRASFNGSTSRAAVEAGIKDIELVYNGQNVRQFTPAQLNYINRINGLCNADGTDNSQNRYAYRDALMVHFAAPWQASIQGEEVNALGTLGMNDDLHLDVTIADDAVAPMLELWLIYSYANRAPGRVLKMLRQSLNVGQAGQYDLNNLRTGPVYSRIHFFSPLVKSVEIQALGRFPAKYTRENLPFLTAVYGLGQETAAFTMPMDYTQQVSDGFPTTLPNGAGISDLNLRLDIGGAAGSSTVFPFISELREELF